MQKTQPNTSGESIQDLRQRVLQGLPCWAAVLVDLIDVLKRREARLTWWEAELREGGVGRWRVKVLDATNYDRDARDWPDPGGPQRKSEPPEGLWAYTPHLASPGRCGRPLWGYAPAVPGTRHEISQWTDMWQGPRIPGCARLC